jgi:hypothetical protein
MRSSARVRVLAIAVLIGGCDQTQPTIAPSSNVPTLAASTAGPGATAGAAPSAAAAQPEEPTSASKIAEALASGAIDEPTSILYRLYANVGDDRLPAEYHGAWSEDTASGDRARDLWETFTKDQQAAVLPFLVRPTSPRSVWAAPGVAQSGTGIGLASWHASGLLTASACENGFIRKQVAPTIPVVIWGECGQMSESAVGAQVDEVALDMADLWGPMTTYMGEPIGDQNVAGDTLADTPEGGDGLLDIYLVSAGLTMHGRALDNDALASTWEWSPLVGNLGTEATSTFIVVDPNGHGGVELRSTIAHEFFHSLQAAHNRRGMLTPDNSGYMWFEEASAKWAEHSFVPEAQSVKVFPWFELEFRSSPKPLWVTDGRNEYASFTWPLFMEQEVGRSAIADAWTRFEGKHGYDQLTAVLDGILSFKDRFRDFAVRVWNQDLEPGSPITPRFESVAKGFPTVQPAGNRAALGRIVTTSDQPFTGYIQPLWSFYFDLKAGAGIKSMTFDFTPFALVEDVDVDLLLNINGTWQRRSGNLGSSEKICDVSEAIVILANHATGKVGPASGSWDVKGDTNACNAKGSYSVVLTGPKTGAGTYSGTGDVYCAGTTIDGRIYWSATAIFPTAPFGDLSNFMLQQNVSNFDTVSATAGGMETGLWQASSNLSGQTAHVGGSGASGTNAHVSGDGTFTDSTGAVFSIHITADCSDTSY